MSQQAALDSAHPEPHHPVEHPPAELEADVGGGRPGRHTLDDDASRAATVDVAGDPA